MVEIFNMFAHWFELFKQSDADFKLEFIVAVITLVSVYLFYIDYRNRKRKERAEKSIKIAEDFSKNIIPKFNLLNEHFTKSKIFNSNKEKYFLKFEDFTESELYDLTEDKITPPKKSGTPPDNSKTQNTNEKAFTYEYVNKYIKAIDENNNISVDGKEIPLKNFIYDLCNELECMCMYISTKVADEKYIYHSLHDKFFKVICLTYIAITLATDDKDIENTYYISTIDVFNVWKRKHIKNAKNKNFFNNLGNNIIKGLSYIGSKLKPIFKPMFKSKVPKT